MTYDMTRRYDIRNCGATELRNLGDGLKKYASGITCHANHVLRLAAVLLLMIGVQSAWGQDATQDGYVFIRSNSRFLNSPTDNSSYQSTPTGTTTFSPQTCFWTGSSGSTFSNDLGYYLYDTGGNNYEFRVDKNNSSNCTISGDKIQVGDHWLGEWGPNNNNRQQYWDLRSSQNNGYSCVNPATKRTYNLISTNPTINGPSEITDLGTANHTYSRGSDATYRAAYYNYYFQNTNHYFASDNSTSLNVEPSNHSFTYSWSLTGIGNDYAEINTETGVVDYKSSTSSNVVATVTLTATSTTDNTIVLTATKSVTFKPLPDPTTLTITSANPMTMYVGNTGNIAYSLTPSPCYNNVTFSSGSAAIATVNSSGVVTGVATGTTTITVTAHKIDNSTTSDLTKTVNVIVRDKVATPVITFTPDPSDNTKATVTITCTTPGTTIYYTIDDSDDPTSGDQNYTTTFIVSEHQVVKAIAIKTTDGTYWDDSDVATGTYVSCTTDAPVISYTQSSGSATVTITAETGATIYYTTNGTNPTTSSSSGTTTVTINGVSSGTTVKAFAKKGICQASAIVSQEIITSGVSGGTVTLFDYEDHNWSYYHKSPYHQFYLCYNFPHIYHRCYKKIFHYHQIYRF